MCGFVVLVNGTAGVGLGADAPALPDLSTALATIDHRGPDDSVQLNVGPCAFGFQRLAIIDTEGSRQPLRYPAVGTRAGRWTLVCNGEIYNYQELRAHLTTEFGCMFVTDGDMEVLAAALDVWGIDALDRLRGMFAFAAWDNEEGILHAGRDPFGIKPLYYASTESGLLLASEKKALLALSSLQDGRQIGAGQTDASRVDSEALSYYLTLQYVPEPRSLHRGISRLAAGERLTYKPGGFARIEQWARPMFRPTAMTVELSAPSAQTPSAPVQPGAAPVSGLSYPDVDVANGFVGGIRDALRDSVRAHMIADVPVGAFLSSGVDSTAIVALAREVNPDIRVFTAGFDADGYSEVEIASQTAAALGLRHTTALVTQDDVLAELPRIIWHLDDPLADPSLIPLYFVARAAAREVTVVLSGEGADELFGGYEIYREPASLAPVGRLPHPVQRGLRAVAGVIPEGVKGRSFLYRATTPIESRYYGNARIFDEATKERLMRGPAASHTDVTAGVYAAAETLDDVATMQYVDLRTWLPGDILTKADRMSMAHSLELRVPFLDRRVFAAAAQLPTELKLPKGSRVTKAALRLAVRGIVPDFVVDRRKLGFPTPTRVWLRGTIGEWAAEVMYRSAAGDLLDLGYAQSLLSEHRKGVADNSRKVWTVLTFCLWHAIFVERSLPVGRPAATPRVNIPGQRVEPGQEHPPTPRQGMRWPVVAA